MTNQTSNATELQNAAETAQGLGDHVLKSAAKAYDTTRNFADASLDQAQRLARRSLNAVSDTGAKAQKTLSRYADHTGDYVANQPMKSVLIAAAAGAAITALFLSALHRRDR